MKLTLYRVDLPLRHMFAISRESTCVVRSLIVRLEQDGIFGYGEAAESAYYNVKVEDIQELLEGVRDRIERYTLADPEAFWYEMAPIMEENRFAQSALDCAACDLWGKLREEPLYRLWGLGRKEPPLSSYTLGIDSIEVMIEKMKEYPDWPIYKIKLGTDHDIEIVQALREHTNASFRVDANCAWTPDQAIRNAELLKPLGVDLIEQPLPPEDVEGMRHVHARSELPIIADESCRTEEDLDQCAGMFDGVNIKLSKCGGLTPAKRMYKRARKWGLKCMAGCMVESTVGISSAAQLAPAAEYCDLDGAMLIDKTVATGVTLEKGKLVYPEESGCGSTLKRRVAVPDGNQ